MAKQPKKSESKAQSPEPKAKSPRKSPGASASAAGASAAGGAPKSASKTTAQKKPAQKPESKPQRPNLLAGGLIDTSLAASAAANLLVARRKGRDQIDDPISIEQIKSDLAKPAAAVAGELLEQHAESTGNRRPNLPTGPASHSQTVGHTAERTYVPRRTAG